MAGALPYVVSLIHSCNGGLVSVGPDVGLCRVPILRSPGQQPQQNDLRVGGNVVDVLRDLRHPARLTTPTTSDLPQKVALTVER